MDIPYDCMVYPYNVSLLHLLFTRARGEIFRELFADGSRETHLRQLVRDCGLSLGAVQDEVTLLFKAGLLSRRRDGNRLYYRANMQHPLFPELQGLVLKTTGLQEVLAKALKSIPGLDLAFVYGSLASGPGNSASDIDLMVIGRVGLRTLAPRLRKASEKLGREINPHVIEAKAWTERLKRGDAFIADVTAKPKLFVKGGSHELERLG